MKILIAAGGTGGHLYPAIALARELRKRSCQILFAARANDLTVKTLSAEKFDFVQTRSAPISGMSPFKILPAILQNISGVSDGTKILADFKPDCSVGFGAYISVPVLIAAALRKIPILLHEQNVEPGRANRLCSLLARKVATSFDETGKFFGKKSVYVGNLVREDIFELDRRRAFANLGLQEGKLTLLVFGGSAGAKSINLWVRESLKELEPYREKIQFLHVSGKSEESEKLKRAYLSHGIPAVVLDYSDRMSDCYAACDLAVCRSGATTVAELIATRTPAILIPYPYATGGHQETNARFLQSRSTASVILESDPDPARQMAEILKECAGQPDKIKKMKNNYATFKISLKDSAQKLADIAIELGSEKKRG